MIQLKDSRSLPSTMVESKMLPVNSSMEVPRIREKQTEKEKNNGKGDSASAPSRFASLSEGEMQQILTERHSDEIKQMINWSVSTFKGKLKVFRFKIVKYKTRAFNRKFQIKPIG